jgi:hypothetical protein
MLTHLHMFVYTLAGKQPGAPGRLVIGIVLTLLLMLDCALSQPHTHLVSSTTLLYKGWVGRAS